jgi:hypothetical protein
MGGELGEGHVFWRKARETVWLSVSRGVADAGVGYVGLVGLLSKV